MQRVVERTISLVAEQALKTIRRPSRVVRIPYLYLVSYVLLPLGYLGVLIFIRCRFPSHWMPKQLKIIDANYQFRSGWRLLNENDPIEAWRAFERCIQTSNDDYHYAIAAVCLYNGLGRMREAIELFQQANRIRLSNRAFCGFDGYDEYCLLDGFWTTHIGHTAQIDYVIKLRMLDGRDPKDTLLYVPRLNEVPNRFLVEQWRPHLRLITDAGELPFPEKCAKDIALDFYVPGVSGVGRYYLWELAAQTYQRWAREGRKPLLRLTEEVQDRGRKALASAGMPPEAWFVSLHVREPLFKRHHRALHGVLDANIGDYKQAIDEIVRRGGWVIRMGDPSMTALPALPNVLDYCHSAIRSDWMDVFLAATSRFFIGTPSGVCYVAQDYGVPCVLTNWWPPAQRPWHPGDIFVPKLLRRTQSGETLSLAESLNEPFGYCHSESYLRESHGISVHDNDPEEIRDAIVEMIERTGGRPNYDKGDLAMRERAEGIYASIALQLYNSPAAFGAGTLAREFLRRNPSFLEA